MNETRGMMVDREMVHDTLSHSFFDLTRHINLACSAFLACIFIILQASSDGSAPGSSLVPYYIALFILSAPPLFIAASAIYRGTDVGLAVALIWIAFALAYPISGLAHLVMPDGQYRGFIDIIRDSSVDYDALSYSIAAVATAQFSFQLAFSTKLRGPNRTNRQLSMPAGFIPVSAGLLALGFISFVMLFGTASLVNDLTYINRDFEVMSGLARYVFMSQWSVWGAFMLYAAYAYRAKRQSSIVLATLIFSAYCTLVVFWTGGRSSTLTFLLPAILFISHFRPTSLRAVVGTSAFVFALYFIYATWFRVILTSDSPNSSGIPLAIDIFDWQIGRFSMTSFSHIYGNIGSLNFTFFNDILKTINIPANFLGFNGIEGPMSFNSIVGERLRGDYEVSGIVAGSIAECLYNGGIPLVAAIYFLGGKLSKFLCHNLRSSDNILTLLISSFAISLICSNFFIGPAFDIAYRFTVFGAPIIIYFVIQKFSARPNL
jgi:hypothetical protein